MGAIGNLEDDLLEGSGVLVLVAVVAVGYLLYLAFNGFADEMPLAWKKVLRGIISFWDGLMGTEYKYRDFIPDGVGIEEKLGQWRSKIPYVQLPNDPDGNAPETVSSGDDQGYSAQPDQTISNEATQQSGGQE
jgi:hypothetical protein